MTSGRHYDYLSSLVKTHVHPRYNRPAKDWFAHADPDAFDAECNNKFGDLVQDARAEKLDHWQSSKDGSLALIILLDQFTRMIFRGTPDAFSSDPKALDLATRSIANGWDKQGTVTEALTFVSRPPAVPTSTGAPATEKSSPELYTIQGKI